MYTYDEQILSDLHKDALGYRPRDMFWAIWSDADSNVKQAIWDDLLVELDSSINEERMRHEMNTHSFEVQVAENMNLGARDRKSAIKWIVQSLNPSEMDLMYGGSWVCFELDLPYSMADQFEDVCKELQVRNYQ